MKMRMGEKDLQDIIKSQANIMDQAKQFVAPKGRLVYATCSLLPSENERQVERFLKENSEYSTVPVSRVWKELGLPDTPPQGSPFLRISPAVHGTDGFFVAILQRHATST